MAACLRWQGRKIGADLHRGTGLSAREVTADGLAACVRCAAALCHGACASKSDSEHLTLHLKGPFGPTEQGETAQCLVPPMPR